MIFLEDKKYVLATFFWIENIFIIPLHLGLWNEIQGIDDSPTHTHNYCKSKFDTWELSPLLYLNKFAQGIDKDTQ